MPDEKKAAAGAVESKLPADEPDARTLDVRACPVCRRSTAAVACGHCGFGLR